MRRLLSLMIALAIAAALPSVGGVPTAHLVTAKADCACPNGDADCGKHGELGCKGALACAAQCGTANPMLGAEPGAAPSAPNAASHPMRPAATLVSLAAAPPFRPPTASIPA